MFSSCRMRSELCLLFTASLLLSISATYCCQFQIVYNTVLYVPHTHTHPFNGLFSGTTRLSQYQKGKTNLDFTEARDSGISWAISVCTSLQTDNHASTPPLSFLQAGCPSCNPTNSVKALKAKKINGLIVN